VLLRLDVLIIAREQDRPGAGWPKYTHRVGVTYQSALFLLVLI
jgi:hypothetical protein